MAATAIETDTNLNFELIEIENLKPSKTNTRTTFVKEDLSKLAASIKQHGILQPLVVRVCSDDADSFEIIAGERRFRASKQAKIKLIPCKIVECDDVEAVEIQASENLDRVDLNPIEEAYTWQNLLEATGLTQAKLAARYKRSQSHIANRLRLIKLPDEWQQKIVDEEIPATFGRDLASWAKYPQVFEALPKAIKESKAWRESDYELNMEELHDCLADAVLESSANVRQAAFSVTDELKEELQVVELPDWMGVYAREERAFNVALFEKLQKEAEIEQKKNKESKSSGNKGTNGKGTLFDIDDDGGVVTREVKDTRSPVEIQADIDHAEKEGRKKRKELLDRKYADWKCAWYQEAIGGQLDHRNPSDGFLFKLLLFYSVTMDSGINDFRGQGLRESVKTWGGKIKGERYKLRANSWDGINSVQSSGKDLAATALAHYIRIPIEHSAFDHHQIGEIAKELGIDIEKEWKLTDDFLQLHTKPQLLELAQEWKFPLVGLEDMKRDDLALAILEMESQLRLEFDKKKDAKKQPAQAPKALVRVKLPK